MRTTGVWARLRGLRGHSFGRHALDAGMDLVTLATLLGHEDLKLPVIYSGPSHEDLVRAVGWLEAGSRRDGVGEEC
jgi:hypothetical protein